MIWKNDVRAWIAALAFGAIVAGCADSTSPRMPSQSSASESMDRNNSQADDGEGDGRLVVRMLDLAPEEGGG